jgi:tetratricopeptide (TPR) repeat protein
MNRALLLKRILVPVFFFALSFHQSSGQQTVGKETLAIDYFQQGNYEKALPIFAKLAQSYPDNPMYNYYYGVSLIKNDLFETAAKEALLNSVVDKTPANANFYLGNYFHALGQWQEAKDFYDRYAKTGSKQEKKSLRFEYYVSLCEQKSNPFKPKKSTDPALFGETSLKPPPKIDENIFPVPDALKKASFNFQVNELLAYHSIEDFKGEASKVLFTRAWICTGKNDSIISLTDSLRKVHDNINRVDTRLGIVQQIVDCEQKSYQFLRDREKFLEQSRVKESAYWDKEGKKAAIAYNSSIQERENRLTEERKIAEKQAETPPPVVISMDTVKAEPVIIAVVPDQSSQAHPSENLVYKVQVGSFKNNVMSASFKQTYAKISKIRKIDKYTDERKYTVYTVGNFTHAPDASRMKEQLIREGMKNAVVVTYDKTTGRPAKPEPIDHGKKEAAQNVSPKPDMAPVEIKTTSSPKENLIFKVQIGSFKNDLQPTTFRKAKQKISKLMTVEKYTDSKKNVVYTVGNTPSYQDIVQLKGQMVTEGIKDAFVAAYLNGERIKVSEAKKIMEGK